MFLFVFLEVMLQSFRILPFQEIPMFITITTSHPTPEQWKLIKPFMDQFLPRLRHLSGVHAVYFSFQEDKGDETTFII
jgi:hypothetical protein